ncbi:MAG: HAD-IA family hydrolase [Lachnospiraceae bacterium]|nr:HAD-IA family hydrolase [Lachnospiraceae bacterium]
MKYTDIAWDFDGTLFDSYPNCVRAFCDMLKSYGYDEDPEEVRKKMVVTIRYAREYYAAQYDLDMEEMGRRYKEMEGFRPDIVKPYPEVEQVLRTIKESGRRNFLYTNRNHDAIRYLEAYDLTKYFDGFMTDEEMPKYKPDPSGAFLLRDQYGIAPGKLLMVGDRDVDILSVKPAGFDGCFFNTNNLEIPECADFCIDSPGELLNHL